MTDAQNLSRRGPGGLTPLASYTSRLKTIIGNAAQQYPGEKQASLLDLLGTVAQEVDRMAHVQDDFNRRLWYGWQGLPAKHALTHMGGSDNVSGHTIPTSIDVSNIGATGNPHEGFAPIGHVHPVSDLIAGLADLDQTEADAIVADMQKDMSLMNQLLFRILDALANTVDTTTTVASDSGIGVKHVRALVSLRAA